MRQSGSRPGRPPKRASVGLSLAASHLAAAAGHHPQHSLKKHRMDNGDYYENGHLANYPAICACSLRRVERDGVGVGGDGGGDGGGGGGGDGGAEQEIWRREKG
uniref:Uncharacterized protein n=1 Tax=Vespula pensylvanica TaxID=30213 RepID=A0A834KHI6_VESPE|nr:hypothetical protein H0235_014507 [Vespula pensylvanica]